MLTIRFTGPSGFEKPATIRRSRPFCKSLKVELRALPAGALPTSCFATLPASSRRLALFTRAVLERPFSVGVVANRPSQFPVAGCFLARIIFPSLRGAFAPVGIRCFSVNYRTRFFPPSAPCLIRLTCCPAIRCLYLKNTGSAQMDPRRASNNVAGCREGQATQYLIHMPTHATSKCDGRHWDPIPPAREKIPHAKSHPLTGRRH